MRKATVFDVANLAGVSIKTVSRVVDGEPHARSVAKELVDQAIEELNYRPDQSAQKLTSYCPARGH